MDGPLSKEFLSSFFAAQDSALEASNNGHGHHAHGGEAMLPQGGLNMGMLGGGASSSPIHTHAYDPLGLGGLSHMNMQVDGQSQQQGHPPPSPHAQGHGGQAALEQQLRLARLRQLQVQHEILQQQVRQSPFSFPTGPFACAMANPSSRPFALPTLIADLPVLQIELISSSSAFPGSASNAPIDAHRAGPSYNGLPTPGTQHP
jgi:hypothetical protein